MYFELLDHPADIGFRAFASSLPELFVSSARALVSIILDPTNITASEPISLSVEAIDVESLLVSWLNEVLYLVDAKRAAIWNIDIRFFTDTSIRAVVYGEPRSSEKHPPRVVVKAVTYHQLRIRQNGSTWSCEVYVDV